MKKLIPLFLFLFIAGCQSPSDPEGDSTKQVLISIQNTSQVKLENFIIAGRSIGTVNPDAITKYYSFNEFTFDTGMPDEDASAVVDGRSVNNHHRGFWCGTEKITINSGKYIVEVNVRDTSLILFCNNAPTIFDDEK